jgi:DNA-binding response OmpR family regulator
MDRAHLRRAAKQVVAIESFTFGDVELNFKKYVARKGGRALDLSAREFEILRYLIRQIVFLAGFIMSLLHCYEPPNARSPRGEKGVG